MKTLSALCGLVLGLLTGVANAAIIQMGDLNIISDAGNASDGLRYLDMTYSDGLTSAAALSNGQSTYANARFATAAEFDDLFSAAGISYDGALTASDGFTAGGTGVEVISSGSNYDGGDLRNALGLTLPDFGGFTIIWTDPDGDGDASSTRDRVLLSATNADVRNDVTTPADSRMGWLIVSDSAVIPEPSRALLSLFGFAAVGLRRRRS